jgi:hypothetical protein
LSPLETARGCLSVTQPPLWFLQLHQYSCYSLSR